MNPKPLFLKYMVFLGVVPLAVGAFGNYIVPLQIGAPDSSPLSRPPVHLLRPAFASVGRDFWP